MVKRILCAALALMLLPALATAELKWREDTPAMTLLKEYIETVNKLLAEHGEYPVNSIFSNFSAESVMGITAEDNAEIPETVEITVRTFHDSMNSLELRVSEIERFPVLAAAMIKALYGDGMTWEDAIRVPTERAKKALKDPGNSFREPVDEMNGTIPRTYYAYDPDPYHNGIHWIQLTLIFPRAGTWDGEGLVLGTQDEGLYKAPEEEFDPDYEGFFSQDDYTHLEVFATATPEPDSAAAEYDFR